MKKLFLLPLLLIVCATGGFAQAIESTPLYDGRVVLNSYVAVFPKPAKPGTGVRVSQEVVDSTKFDLIGLKNGCSELICLSYGARVGINWDIFTVSGGAVSSTRMVRIGKYKWTDRFVVPYIEGWPKLAQGETRTVVFNASGSGSSDGLVSDSNDGVGVMNGDGSFSATGQIGRDSYANAGLGKQVSSYVTDKKGKKRNDGYSPTIEALEGHMYLVRVVDDRRDYFVLVRVDDLKRGERLSLSYKKLDLSKSIL